MITRECDRCGGEHIVGVPVCDDCQASKLRVERQRTDAAQAEVARRGDVMLAALNDIGAGLYNEAAKRLAAIVMPGQVYGHTYPSRPAETLHTTIGGRGAVGRLGR